MGEPTISIIAAVARNNVIGRDNDLPWRVKADMQHFRKTTTGKPLIMGRKTFAPMGKALPGRLNIVVTRDATYAADSVAVAHSLEEALAIGRNECAATGATDIMIGGGGAIYSAAMDLADRLVITHIDAEVAGDTVFPTIDPGVWQPDDAQVLPEHEGDTATARLVIYTRRDR